MKIVRELWTTLVFIKKKIMPDSIYDMFNRLLFESLRQIRQETLPLQEKFQIVFQEKSCLNKICTL